MFATWAWSLASFFDDGSHCPLGLPAIVVTSQRYLSPRSEKVRAWPNDETTEPASRKETLNGKQTVCVQPSHAGGDEFLPPLEHLVHGMHEQADGLRRLSHKNREATIEREFDKEH